MRPGLARALDNCMAAIRHARNFGIPIAFTRQSDGPEVFERSAPSAWISGFEPKRSDMVFERQQPSCYSNQLFANVVSQAGSFAIAGLGAEESCLATAIDASRRGHHVTFLSDASASRCRRNADAAAVHARGHERHRTFCRRRQHRPLAGGDVAATSQRASLWMS